MLSHLREDGDLLHLYLYHFLYETGAPVEVEVALPGSGAAYRVDGWTGNLRPHAGVRQQDGRTLLAVTLAPGETALLTLDRSAPAAPPSSPASPETVAELSEWTIAVESWDAGDLTLITEDRGLGYQTREVRPNTAVTRLDAGTGPLRPWRDIAEVGPEVSGVGEYTTTPAPRPGTAAGPPVHPRPRLDRRGARLRPDQRRRAEGIRHLSADGRHHRGPAPRRQHGDDPGGQLTQQPTARPRLLRAGTRHRDGVGRGWAADANHRGARPRPARSGATHRAIDAR